MDETVLRSFVDCSGRPDTRQLRSAVMVTEQTFRSNIMHQTVSMSSSPRPMKVLTY